MLQLPPSLSYPLQAHSLLLSQPSLCYALSLSLDRLLGNLPDDIEPLDISSSTQGEPMHPVRLDSPPCASHMR